MISELTHALASIVAKWRLLHFTRYIVAALLEWSGQNCSHLRQIVLLFCVPKIIKIDQFLRVIPKIKVAQFIWDSVIKLTAIHLNSFTHLIIQILTTPQIQGPTAFHVNSSQSYELSLIIW